MKGARQRKIIEPYWLLGDTLPPSWGGPAGKSNKKTTQYTQSDRSCSSLQALGETKKKQKPKHSEHSVPKYPPVGECVRAWRSCVCAFVRAASKWKIMSRHEGKEKEVLFLYISYVFFSFTTKKRWAYSLYFLTVVGCTQRRTWAVLFCLYETNSHKVHWLAVCVLILSSVSFLIPSCLTPFFGKGWPEWKEYRNAQTLLNSKWDTQNSCSWKNSLIFRLGFQDFPKLYAWESFTCFHSCKFIQYIHANNSMRMFLNLGNM